jgi:hypothetical protein
MGSICNLTLQINKRIKMPCEDFIPKVNAMAHDFEQRAEELFGFKLGTKANRAAAMYMRPNGATTEEIVNVLGGPQLNLLKVAEAKGGFVEKTRIPNGKGRPIIRYRIHTGKPAQPSDPKLVANNEACTDRSGLAEAQRRLTMLEEKYAARLLEWTELFVANWLENSASWVGAPYVRALPGILEGLGISPLPEEVGDPCTYDEHALRLFPIYSDLRSLVAYGIFGLYEGYGFFDAVGAQFPETGGERESSYTEFPWRWLGLSSTEEAVTAAHAAAARYLVDCPTMDTCDGLITAHQIAALAQVSPKYIRNLMSQNSNSPLCSDDGIHVPAERVREWLLQRPDFLPTIRLDGSVLTGRQSVNTLQNVQFVPVASDGTKFSPECRTDSGYTVVLTTGYKTFDKYDDALAALQIETTPSWFVPGKGKENRRVFGTSWARTSRININEAGD